MDRMRSLWSQRQNYSGIGRQVNSNIPKRKKHSGILAIMQQSLCPDLLLVNE